MAVPTTRYTVIVDENDRVVRRGHVEREVWRAGQEALFAEHRRIEPGTPHLQAIQRELDAQARGRTRARDSFITVTLPWSRELAVELRTVIDSRSFDTSGGSYDWPREPRAARLRQWAPYTIVPLGHGPQHAPTATGRPSSDLNVLRRHLRRLAARTDGDGPRQRSIELARDLVADIDAATTTWTQPELAEATS